LTSGLGSIWQSEKECTDEERGCASKRLTGLLLDPDINHRMSMQRCGVLAMFEQEK